ncbi:MAG: hypothetical protein ACKO0V_08670 [bacterium]
MAVWTRREWALNTMASLALPGVALAQQAKTKEKPAAGDLPGPEPIPSAELSKDLPTIPVRADSPSFSFQMVDTALQPADRTGLWVLDFAFKPLRIRTVEIPGKGRRNIFYLYYRVVNRTEEPRLLVPQFSIVTNTNKRIDDVPMPQAVKLIQAREDPAVKLLGSVDMVGTVPPSKKEGVLDAVYGVAIWNDFDSKASRFSIYVRGLSDGYQLIKATANTPEQKRYKSLKIDFQIFGDHIEIHEDEIRLMDPAYSWVYW